VSLQNPKSNLLDSGHNRADPQRLEGISQIKPPLTKEELRSVLGAFGYYREFIPHFAKIDKPLTDMTSKKTPNTLEWTEEHQHCFERLRDELQTQRTLRIPRIDVPYKLHTDSSGWAVGAALSQDDVQGVEGPLAFAS